MQASVIIGAAALVAALYGAWHDRTAGTPLFFRIVTFGVACYALSTCYDALKDLIVATDSLPALALQQGSVLARPAESAMPLVTGAAGFSIGLVGYAGMFFFIFSSYFGALDSLADGGERRLRAYRWRALAAPLALAAIAGALSSVAGIEPFALAALIPAAGTSYFAAKHLIMPDIEMGIIRVMRPYNACMLALCMLQPAVLLLSGGIGHLAACVLAAAATLAVLPLAAMGVRKWFQ